MHDDDSGDDDATMAAELLAAGVPRTRVKGLFQGRMEQSHIDDIAESVMAHKLETGRAKGGEMPEIKQLVSEAKPPPELLDPLFMHLMKDPVVLSSGRILDRNSAVDENDNLRFKRCPFTRVILEKKVYPLDEKKKQIKDFKLKRDDAITVIAQKLIENGKFTSFGAVLEAVEDYLKDLGDSNYLPLARELADIWSEIDGSNAVPLFLFVDVLKGEFRPNKWRCALKSGNIEYDVGKILVATEYIGGGRSDYRNRFALALYSEHGVLAHRCELFQHYDRSRASSTFHLFDENDSIVAKARKGYIYKLEFYVHEGNNSVSVKGWICKIFPEAFASSYYRMRDQDGEMGLFMGSVQSGKANGDGSMEYDDGKRFVGQFYNGMMSTGVLYRGPRALFTMKNARWSKPPNLNEFVLQKYPQEVLILTSQDSSRARQETREGHGSRDPPLDRQGKHEILGSREPPFDQREISEGRGTHEIRSVRDHNEYNPKSHNRDDNSVAHNSIRHEKHSTRGERHISLSMSRNNGSRSISGSVQGRDRHTDVHSHSRGAADVPVMSPSVPGYIPRRGKNHDEYSEVTKLTWNDQDVSIASGSHNNDNEPDILLEEIPEVLSKGLNPDYEENNLPIFFAVKKVVGTGTNNDWQCAIQSGPLLDEVSMVLVAVDLQENHKCSLALTLYNKRDGLVERCNITEKLMRADDKGCYYRKLTVEDDIVSKARQGSKYKLEYAIGDIGDSKVVHAEDWICKIFPASMNVPTFPMQDQDGEPGTYMGPVDMEGRGDGSGVMEYNDGKRFVGMFKEGDMFEGVLYYGSDYLCSMQSGKWDTENRNQFMIERYPQDVHILDNRVGIC